jgi:hypothetical protein
VIVDAAGAASALRLQRLKMAETGGKLEHTGEMVTLPARTILVAAGRSRTPCSPGRTSTT